MTDPEDTPLIQAMTELAMHDRGDGTWDTYPDIEAVGGVGGDHVFMNCAHAAAQQALAASMGDGLGPIVRGVCLGMLIGMRAMAIVQRRDAPLFAPDPPNAPGGES